MPEFCTIVVGGGASGVLLASRLVRKSPRARVTIIEPREALGRGLAYSTRYERHLLNVPAGRMSAFSDDSEHFVRYLRERFGNRYTTSSFAPRPVYGDYLEAIANEARAFAGARWQHVRARALAVSTDDFSVRAICEDGRTYNGDALIVATGNAQPAPWIRAHADIVAGERFFPSAWDEGALICPDRDGDVLLLGTGLTAVDAVIGLRSNGHRGTIWMVSRRGLLPSEHRFFDAPPDLDPDATSMNDLLGAARTLDRRPHVWRFAMDSLRPRTNALWQALSVDDRRRFVRHALPFWNIHRHRMAPEIAEFIAAEIAADRLRMVAGRTGTFAAHANGLRVPIALRGEDRTIELEVGRAINCSGPTHDFRLLDNPLIGNLLEQGTMQPSELEIGINVAPSGALRDAAGAEAERIFTIGPVRFGTLIETTAVPEIRAQAEDLANLIASRFDLYMAVAQ
ncbi:MAG TPA: FAD/NAD(P)-binding protein [Candidatus Acidoferrum sp.]|nr:FAD/NAD(P)-binding protein [Candidatus Acidoferrum sp.]